MRSDKKAKVPEKVWGEEYLPHISQYKNNQTMQFVMLGLGFIGTVSQIVVLSKKKKKEKVLLTLDNEEKDNNLKAS